MTAHVIPPASADLDQAREYLAKVVHWPEPGGEGYVDIVWAYEPPNFKPDSETGKKKFPWAKGRAVKTLDEAISTIKWKLTQKDTRDIYVCMSSQRECGEVWNSNGYVNRKAFRNTGNALKFKSLFIDLDAKGEDEDSYANINDAVAALSKFLQDTGLPSPSVLVSSGGGLHVYWTLDRALTPEEWLPLVRGNKAPRPEERYPVHHRRRARAAHPEYVQP